MGIIGKIRAFRRSPRKYILTIILGIIVIVLGLYSYNASSLRRGINYQECLDKEAVSVNGRSLTFRDVAFYVIYEESEVEDQAKVYYAENTKKYWNLHIDGEFVRVAARNAAIQMAIHDELFYQMAVADGIELSEDDEEALSLSQADFWSDVRDYDKHIKVGVTEEDIKGAMRKIAIAQKYQEIYAGLKNAEVSDYDFTGDLYKELLEKNDHKVNKELWRHINFGTVSL